MLWPKAAVVYIWMALRPAVVDQGGTYRSKAQDLAMKICNSMISKFNDRLLVGAESFESYTPAGHILSRGST